MHPVEVADTHDRGNNGRDRRRLDDPCDSASAPAAVVAALQVVESKAEERRNQPNQSSLLAIGAAIPERRQLRSKRSFGAAIRGDGQQGGWETRGRDAGPDHRMYRAVRATFAEDLDLASTHEPRVTAFGAQRTIRCCDSESFSAKTFSIRSDARASSRSRKILPSRRGTIPYSPRVRTSARGTTYVSRRRWSQAA